MTTIAIKLGPEVGLAKVPGPGLTQVYSENFKKIFEVLIFHIKKIKKQSIWIHDIHVVNN